MSRKVTKKETQHYFWEPFLFKNNKIPKGHLKNDHPKSSNFMSKGCHNLSKIDAKTHQKSMPKYVAEKIMNIIKHHVFLNGRIIQTQ